jgi:hypothetical protein
MGCDVFKKNSAEASRWGVQFMWLVVYKAEHGDCSVPKGWAEDAWLANWVDNQRAYKKKCDRGETNPRITVARMARLDTLGCEWDPGPKGRGGAPSDVAWRFHCLD